MGRKCLVLEGMEATKGTGVILMFGSHLTGVCFFFRGRPTGRSVAQTPCLSAIFSVH